MGENTNISISAKVCHGFALTWNRTCAGTLERAPAKNRGILKVMRPEIQLSFIIFACPSARPNRAHALRCALACAELRQKRNIHPFIHSVSWIRTASWHSLLPQRREPAHVAGLEANVPNFKDKSRKLSVLQRSLNSNPKNQPWRLKIHLAIYRPSLHVSAYNYSGGKALLGQSRLKDEIIQTHLGTGLSMRHSSVRFVRIWHRVKQASPTLLGPLAAFRT